MAVLRAATHPVSAAELAAAVADADLRDAGQRARCIAALAADGLLESLPRNRFQLPSGHR